MALGDRIKLRRTELGISASELAKRAGISKGYLSSLENGDATRPSGTILFQLAQQLGTTIADLLEQEVRPTITVISEPLRDFAVQAQLPDEDVRMLSQVRFRGAQPKSVEDWRYLYESIKRSISTED